MLSVYVQTLHSHILSNACELPIAEEQINRRKGGKITLHLYTVTFQTWLCVFNTGQVHILWAGWVLVICPETQSNQMHSASVDSIWLTKCAFGVLLNSCKYTSGTFVLFFNGLVNLFQNSTWNYTQHSATIRPKKVTSQRGELLFYMVYVGFWVLLPPLMFVFCACSPENWRD